MDGWGGVFVTLSSGIGLGLRYVYIAYVWIAWPSLVEDATIQASADYIRKMFSNMNGRLQLVMLPCVSHGNIPVEILQNPLALWASIFLMYKTVWVGKTTKHGVFYEVLGRYQTSPHLILFAHIAPVSYLYIFSNVWLCVRSASSPADSEDTWRFQMFVLNCNSCDTVDGRNPTWIDR